MVDVGDVVVVFSVSDEAEDFRQVIISHDDGGGFWCLLLLLLVVIPRVVSVAELVVTMAAFLDG